MAGGSLGIAVDAVVKRMLLLTMVLDNGRGVHKNDLFVHSFFMRDFKERNAVYYFACASIWVLILSAAFLLPTQIMSTSEATIKAPNITRARV